MRMVMWFRFAAVITSAAVAAAPVPAGAAQSLKAGGELFYPRAAVNSRGDSVVAWVTNDGAVRAALRHGSARFGAVHTIGRAGNENLPLRSVSVAVTAHGDAVALWPQQASHPPRYRVVAAIAGAGHGFGHSFLVGSSTTALRADPKLLIGPHDDVIAGWHRDDVGLQVAVRHPERAHFAAAQAPMNLPYSDVAWTVTRDYRLYLAWTLRGPGGSFVAMTSGRLDGRWSQIQAISKSGRSGPLLAAAPNGALIGAFRVAEPGEGPLVGAVESLTGQVGRGFTGPIAEQTLTPDGIQADDVLLAVGPHAQAAVSWSSSAAKASWLAVRPASGRFGEAQSLTAVGHPTLPPAAAFDGSGRLTVGAVSSDGTQAQLDIWHAAPDAALGAPVATTQVPASHSLAWSSSAVAAAGSHTVVAWSAGMRGPVRVYSFG